jgi:hypothetical protein
MMLWLCFYNPIISGLYQQWVDNQVAPLSRKREVFSFGQQGMPRKCSDFCFGFFVLGDTLVEHSGTMTTLGKF